MLVKQEQLNPCEVELEIQVDVEQVTAAVDDAYAELGKRLSIPGFRKGKAPRAVLEQFLDKEAVHGKAASKLMEGAYPAALEESKLEPYAPAEVELVKMEIGEPMVFKAKVPLAPKVELGEYVGLEIERPVHTVTDEDVDEEIKRLLERRATYTQVTDRPVREGDVVLVETKDESKPDQHPSREVAEIGKCLPAFDQGVIGMQTDEEKLIELTYPEDFENEELRGKTVPLRVKVIEINEKHIPELTDEWVKENFARQEAEGAEPKPDSPDTLDTVEKLRAALREAMDRTARDMAEEVVRRQVVRKVVEGAQVCFPEVMVEEAVEKRLEELKEGLKRRKLTLDDYLKYHEQSLEELREQYANETRHALKVLLVLGQIAKKENISADEKDVDAEIRQMAEEQGVSVAAINAYLDRTDRRDEIVSRVTRKKVVDFLVHASNIKNVSGQDAAAE